MRQEDVIRRIHPYREGLYDVLSKRWIFVGLTILPAVGLFVFINMLPMLWALAASFYEIGALSPEWHWVGLTNFRSVLNDSKFWGSLYRSTIFAGGSVALQVTAGTALAMLLNRDFKYKRFARAIALLPYIVPTAVLSFIALWMGNSRYGIISQILHQLGLIEQFIPWYGSPELAMLAVIVTSSWKFTIFVTIIVLARLQSIPSSLYEAATVSGASAYRRFVDITLPNLRGVLFITILLRGVWMFNKFDIVYILTKGGPLNKTTIASIYAYRTAFAQLHLGRAAAVSTLLFLILLCAAAVYFYYFEPSKEVRVE